MVKSHLTLRCVIYRSFGNQFKNSMVDHVTQGFRLDGQPDNDSHTSLQCAMMYDCRCLMTL